MKNILTKACAIATASMLMTASCSFASADSVVDTIMSVGTTQAFTDEAVSSDDLNTILQAGLASASAINQQPWFFVAVTNQDVMDQIAGSGTSFTPPAGTAGDTASADGTEASAAPAEIPEGVTADAPAEMPEGAPSMPASSGSAKAALGDSPAAIIIYMDENTASPNASFDCGLAAQNMYLAAASLGYGVKIVSSPTMTLNGTQHDELCELLGVDTSMQAVAVLLIGKADTSTDATSSATTRSGLEEKTNVIE